MECMQIPPRFPPPSPSLEEKHRAATAGTPPTALGSITMALESLPQSHIPGRGTLPGLITLGLRGLSPPTYVFGGKGAAGGTMWLGTS